MYLDKWKGTWVVQESTPLLRPQPPRLRIDLLFRKCCEAETTCGTFSSVEINIEVLTSLKFRSLASYLSEVNTARPRFKTQRMVCAVSHTIIELNKWKWAPLYFIYLVKCLEQLIRFRRIFSRVTQKTCFCSRKSMHGQVLHEKI